MVNSSPPMRAARSVSRRVREQHLGHAPQHVVARQVSPLVVDPLEVVQIDQQQAEGRVAALPFGDPPHQLVFERPAVRQPRQRIGAGFDDVGLDLFGLFLQPLLGGAEAGLQLLVDVHDLGHRAQHESPQVGRIGLIERAKGAVDLPDLRLVLADAVGDVVDQFPQAAGGVRKLPGLGMTAVGTRRFALTDRQAAAEDHAHGQLHHAQNSTVAKIGQEKCMVCHPCPYNRHDPHARTRGRRPHKRRSRFGNGNRDKQEH